MAWKPPGTSSHLSRTPSGPFRTQSSSPSLTRSVSWTWTISPIEKANSDKFFDDMDPWKLGFLRGDTAAPFMARSKLSPDVLGEIWDLADVNHMGQLTKDEFAVAMHLTRAALSGAQLPSRLPDSLRPPLLTEDPFASHDDDPVSVPAPTPSPAPAPAPSPNPTPPPVPESASTLAPAADAPSAPTTENVPVIQPSPEEEPRSSTPPPPYESLPDTLL